MQRIARFRIEPHFVHIVFDGRIVRSGGPELAHELEQRGYEEYTKAGAVGAAS